MKCSNSLSKQISWSPSITSGSGIGASFGFHQSPLPLVAYSHSGIGASFGFHQSPLPAVALSLWQYRFPLDSLGPFLWVFFTPEIACLFELVCLFVNVAFCTFLHNLMMLNISFGCCRHSVFNASVQLTEGRSARDQPKQLPAKKKSSNTCRKRH